MPAGMSPAPPDRRTPVSTPVTPQLELWQGSFGDAYTDRNIPSPEQLQGRVAMWTEILAHMSAPTPDSILEVGANLGINLRALRKLMQARLMAVEPNSKARGILTGDGVVNGSDVYAGIASDLPVP